MSWADARVEGDLVARLLVHVEGQAEESFVGNLLRDRLTPHGYTRVDARLMGNARQRSHRGGVKPWVVVREEIVRHLKGDAGAIATMMVDYYGMPAEWPGRAAAVAVAHDNKANVVQAALHLDVSQQMGAGFNPSRFVPFVLVHEYEALLFSDCDAFARGIGRDDLAAEFAAIVHECGSPERINDSPITAPSKRIIGLLPSYSKVFLGTLAALEIGINSMEQQCPNFRAWIERMIASANN